MLYDLMKTRRSIRKFTHQPIEKEMMDIILNSALLAPSSRSRRPWEFIVVDDKETLHTISTCREHSSDFMKGAAIGIVVIADPNACDVWIEDTSIAATFIQLTAHSLGLGSCWIQIRERFHNAELTAEDFIKNKLNIPSHYKVECMIAIGYPAEEKTPYEESQLPVHKIHTNLF